LEDPAKPYFYEGLSDRERAAFEAGIALASIYHQLVGTPVSRSRRVLRALEAAAKRAFSLQPFRERVEVRVDAKRLRQRGRGPYRYSQLTGDELEAMVVVKYGRARVQAALRYVAELGYPLMYVERVEEL